MAKNPMPEKRLRKTPMPKKPMKKIPKPKQTYTESEAKKWCPGATMSKNPISKIRLRNKPIAKSFAQKSMPTNRCQKTD